MDPGRAVELLEQWETLVKPMRDSADKHEHILLNDSAMEEHISRADRFLERYANTLEPPNERQALIDSFDMAAAFLVESDLNIGILNAGAQAALQISEGAPVSSLPVDEADLPSLMRQMRDMLEGRGPNMSLFRVRATDCGHFIIFRIRLRKLRDGAQALVVATSELAWPPEFDSILGEAFSFTQTEVDIVRMLIECCSVKDIADQRGRSIDTIRAQIKSILAKTATRSQVELIRLILSMMDMTGFAVAGPATTEAWSRGYIPNSNNQGAATLHTTFAPDGRRLDYLIWGDPNGKPCVLLHVEIGMSRWPKLGEQAARKAGIKIITPIRAGYGDSTPLPNKADFTAGVIDDIMHVLKAENVDRFSVISLCADVRFGAHIEKHSPGRMTGLVAVAGTPPPDSVSDYDHMDLWQRFLLVCARYTPHLLTFTVKAGFLMARKYGQRKFLEHVYGKSKADIEQFNDPDIWEAVITGIQICLSDTHSAHKAFARMISEEIKGWHDEFSALEGKVPVHFINGTMDAQATMEIITPFFRDHPWVTYELIEGAGQLLIYSHWDKALKKIGQF
ncbi:LuxR C-terminal-related transcriptional regulator [Halocynthiibacter namhaensis]|uniref:LuxR C-terminal-related transcriptional regulator n=1 Tax=Halocynthiibacter namhaensis TaxID=1290553 RepID=UPI00069165F8|nr:LuxR C-terminal-related transcriptional regulator [Halocynthiibacter namhaensis]